MAIYTKGVYSFSDGKKMVKTITEIRNIKKYGPFVKSTERIREDKTTNPSSNDFVL